MTCFERKAEMINYGMMDIENTIYQLGTAIAGFMAVIAIVFGALECYFGYKLFKIVMGITGFFVGCGLGFLLGFAIITQSGGGGGIAVILALIGGIVGAIIAVKVYFIGLFIYGFSIGFIIVMILEGAPIVAILLGIVIGVVHVIFSRLLIIISTSIVGGASLGAGLSMLGISLRLPMNGAITVLLSLLFIATGLYYQFKVNGGLPSVAKANQKKAGKKMNEEGENVPVAVLSGQLPADKSIGFCEECGTELEEDGVFCSNCGNKVK
jgi:hypothetical protein